MIDFVTLNENAFSRIIDIINKFGPRLCGHKSTHDAADYISKDLAKYSDVKIEEFEVHPLAFLGWVKFMDVMYVICNILLWLNLPVLAIPLGLISNSSFILEFIFYKQYTDKFYPKKVGKNVYGTIEPEGEVKQTIIFSGHHDSAHRFAFYEYTPKWTILRCGSGLILSILLNICSIIETVWQIQDGRSLFHISFEYSKKVRILNTIWLLSVPLALSSWNFAMKDGTPGAGDNLITVSMGIELAKHYFEHKLKNTRLIIASFDGEECGLRGSHEFFQRHKEDLRKMNAVHFNVDSPFFLDEFVLLTSDINGLVQLDTSLATRVQDIGRSVGVACQKKPLPMLLGGTDAAEAARAGIPSTTLIGLPWTVGDHIPVYHTRLDTPDAIEPGAVTGVLKIATAFIEDVDAKSI